MTCCGSDLRDVTDQDDPCPQFVCPVCGKQGPESVFPDPAPEPEEQPSLIDRIRWRIAEFIAPK